MNSADYLIHIIKSFGIHIVFGVVIVLSFNFSPAPKEKPEELEVKAIDAVVIDQSALEQQVQQIQKQKADAKAAEEKRVKDLERRAENAAKKLKRLDKEKSASEKAAADSKRKAKLEKAKADKAKKERLKREKEAKSAEDAANKAKAKKEAQEKALAEAKAKREKEEADRKKKEEEARLEKERQEKLAQEKALQEQLLQEQLAIEQSARRKARGKVVLTEVQKYKALISSKIQQNLIVDETMKGKSCRLNIKLAFSGLVTRVKVLSGEAKICQAAERAVLKAETLPVSKEQDVYQQLRDINLTVEPEF